MQESENISVLDKILSSYASLFEAEKKVADKGVPYRVEAKPFTHIAGEMYLLGA